MKKLSKRRARWLANNQRRIERRRAKRAVKGGIIVQKLGNTIRHSYNSRRRSYIVELPSKMDFEEHIEETIEAFRAIRHASRKRIKISNLDFGGLNKITPAAALVLAAEIDLWRQSLNNSLRAHTDNWNPKIKSLLIEMGLFRLLGLKDPQNEKVEKDTTFLHFLSGDTADNKGDEGALAKQLRIEIEKFTGTIQRALLYKGLTEAMINVNHHAYPDDTKFKTKRYWMSASYKSDQKRLSVFFYDQGVGIPNTLIKSSIMEHIKAGIGQMNDSERMIAALKAPRSSTRLPGRGRGLQDMLDFIKNHKDGIFTIVSYNGVCKAKHFGRKTDDIEISGSSHATKLKGTLITWEVTV